MHLILLRHGESTWNSENRFTGWADPPLSARGREEATAAGRLLRESGLLPLSLHTSLQVRAITTANLALEEAGLAWLPVSRSWRLNERHYGALQGLNKAETAAEFGEEQVKVWRRSYNVPPPPLEPDDPRQPVDDPRYRDLAAGDLPRGECLRDVVARMMPHWESALVPDLRARGTILVVAHGNSLRALVKHLDGMTDAAILELNIPTGVPLVYELGDNLIPRGHRYLGNADEVAARAAAVAGQGQAGG